MARPATSHQVHPVPPTSSSLPAARHRGEPRADAASGLRRSGTVPARGAAVPDPAAPPRQTAKNRSRSSCTDRRSRTRGTHISGTSSDGLPCGSSAPCQSAAWRGAPSGSPPSACRRRHGAGRHGRSTRAAGARRAACRLVKRPRPGQPHFCGANHRQRIRGARAGNRRGLRPIPQPGRDRLRAQQNRTGNHDADQDGRDPVRGRGDRRPVAMSALRRAAEDRRSGVTWR